MKTSLKCNQELIEAYESKRNGCDHKCEDCPLWMNHNGKQFCYFAWEKKWKEANVKRRKEEFASRR